MKIDPISEHLPEKLKKCRSCCVDQPLNNFYTKTYKNKTQYSSYCKKCSSKNCKARYSAERDFRMKLKRKYNLTWEDYINLYNKQEGRCKICSSFLLLTGKSKSKTQIAHVDHCHETMKIRGLLCQVCNTGLGMFKDSEILLTKARIYLNESK